MLVDFSIAAATEDAQTGWLREVFTKGFRGFSSMSSAELLREIHFRGIAEAADALADEDFEDETDDPRIENLIELKHSRAFADAERD
jgi:hypothetical protein